MADRADRSVPGLVVKLGHYPVHHGGLGVIRTLGRLGVPMYAIAEDRFTPSAVSRYLTDRFVWPTTALEEPGHLVAGLLGIGRRIGRKAVLIPTDDESAVLIAEHADALADAFLFPRLAPGLPRRLAGKGGLRDLCAEHGVATPAATAPESRAEIAAFAAEARFPLIVKNLEAFERLRTPAVSGTTLVGSAAELMARAEEWGEPPAVLIQEYLPIESTEDWACQFYIDADGSVLTSFTGVKVRSWPPHNGVTACAVSVPNPELAEITTRFCKSIGFHGVASLDWRYDRRDGQYKLLDFNPRVGAQFRLFEDESGLDVIRVMHLDLTGREVPASAQVDGRRLIVEHMDVRSRPRYRGSPYRTPSVPERVSAVEYAWLAGDDVKPVLAMAGRLAAQAVSRAVARLRSSV